MEHSFAGTPNPRADYHVLAADGHDVSSTNTSVSREDLQSPQGDIPGSLELEKYNKSDKNIYTFHRAKPGILSILADITADGAPLALIVLSFIVLRLDGKEPRDREELSAWENTVTVLGTLFPIIFASIIGRLTYETARWKLERGAALGSLEQLMGSQTVGATLLTQIKLRALNPLSVGLILIWACSPLGGQSILRMLRTRYESNVHPSDLVYFDTNAQSQPSRVDKDDFRPEVRNVKFPFLDTNGGHDWHNLSGNVENADSAFYSALIGIPINMPLPANATFSLESSYINLECPDVTLSTTQNATGSYFQWPDQGDEGKKEWRNGTWGGFDVPEGSVMGAWAIAVDTFVDSYWTNDTLTQERFGLNQETRLLGGTERRPSMFENETDIEVDQARLNLRAQPGVDYATGATLKLLAYCNVAQKYVESRVACDSSAEQLNCSVTAQRPSRRRHASEYITYLSFPQIFRYISKEMPNATALGEEYPSLALQHLNNVGINAINYVEDDQMFSKVNNTLFSHHLGQILNTYILASQMDNWAIGGVTKHQKVTIPVDYSSLVEAYSVSLPWMGLCLLSCFLLLIGGVLSVIFANMVTGPEVLGYASTVLRDSRFIDMPPKTGQMSAIDLTNREKQTRIRYGFTKEKTDGELLIGVGLEETTEPIRNRPTGG
ncbi:hypothetical protein B0T10DRAFT_584460 [Thelonectria olida]|uniref:Uncharacterized protein n=1 Tax=Thelonectria olida TaxID=1576542 RepID=A0A9P9AGR6_9HYPO|nr:hypothetical protein B0T10DRAFT_584460 [Thelonectria olida]